MEERQMPMDYNKIKDNLQVIQFAAANSPMPVERVNKSKGWIDYGVDNQYPKYLQALMTQSPLHSSIVTQKSRMIGGYGFNKTNLNIKTMLFLKNARNEYDLDEILYRCTYDLEVYGAFSLNIVWSKDRESISEVSYLDAGKLRIQAPEEENKYPQIENYWVSDGWENTRKYEPVLYQGFSTRSKRKASQIYYVKEQRAGIEYYGIPVYIPGVNWMQTDFLISDFHNANIKNGMAPSYIVQYPLFNGSPEEKAFLADRLRKEFSNSFNAGRVVVSFSDEKEMAPTFTPIEMNGSDSRFMLLKDQSRESILESHQVQSPILFGVETTAGKLGARNERLEALEAFQHSYMTPKQNILEKVFNRLARVNGITDNLIINRYHEEFRNVDTNIQDMVEILTAEIEPVQKYWILVQNGYTHEIAAKLSQYSDGNQKNPTKSILPSPSEPNKEEMNFNKIWLDIKYSDNDSYYEEDENGEEMFNMEKFESDLNLDKLKRMVKNNN